MSRLNVKVTSAPISSHDAEGLADASDGACVVFSGIVRGSSEGRTVEGLEYEAYAEHAEKQMHLIGIEAQEKWDIGSISMIHRTGNLKVGEISVVVAVAAPHRSEAFDACRFCIDELKKQAAIWKKEIFSDGDSRWVDHP